MKQITVNNETFFYKTEWEDNSDYGNYPVTQFWKEEEQVKYRKYLFFGPIKTKIKPKILFSIPADSNSPTLTKDYWRKRIEHEIELLGRKEELNKGQLI